MEIMISCMEAVVKNWDGFELLNLYTVDKLKYLTESLRVLTHETRFCGLCDVLIQIWPWNFPCDR
jgi:hypothetical protein